MMVDDITSRLVLRTTVSETGRPTIRCEPNDADLRKLIGLGLRTGEHSFEYAVSLWIGSCARALLRAGVAYYETAYWHTKEGEPVGFSLYPIPFEYLLKRQGKSHVLIPKGSALGSASITDKREVLETPRIIELPRDRLLEIRAPSEIPFVEIVRLLAEVSPATRLPFLPPRISPEEANKLPFDFSAFTAVHKRAVGSATRRIGWNARGEFVQEETSYYYICRSLRFERALIVLRDHILAGLNGRLLAIGDYLGFRARITLSDLPTLASVDESERLLETGAKSFEEIMSPFRAL